MAHLPLLRDGHGSFERHVITVFTQNYLHGMAEESAFSGDT